MSFMRKIIDALNMNNWNKRNETQSLNYNERNDCYKVLRQQKKMQEAKAQQTSNSHNTPNKTIIKQPKSTYMSKYDIERYAIECNAYVVREERKEQNKKQFS